MPIDWTFFLGIWQSVYSLSVSVTDWTLSWSSWSALSWYSYSVSNKNLPLHWWQNSCPRTTLLFFVFSSWAIFLIYINDIYAFAPKVSFHLFAENTCLFYCHRNLKTLETYVNVVLSNISSWLKANKLMLNIKNIHLLTFNSNKNNDNKRQIKLFIDKEELELRRTKYLGIYFDKNLT